MFIKSTPTIVALYDCFSRCYWAVVVVVASIFVAVVVFIVIFETIIPLSLSLCLPVRSSRRKAGRD